MTFMLAEPPNGCGYNLDGRDENGCEVARSVCGKFSMQIIRSSRLFSEANRTCGANEELKHCGESCPLSCWVSNIIYLTNFFFQPLFNPEKYTPIGCWDVCNLNVCQCKEGYARDQSGNCVSIARCHEIQK